MIDLSPLAGPWSIPSGSGDPFVVVFVEPTWLLLLLVLPLWGILVWPRRGHGVAHPRGGWTARVTGAGGRWRLLLPLLPKGLRALALATLVLALAAPHRVGHFEETTLSGPGMSLVVDLSTSMLARDMGDGVSRMEVAREAAIRFARERVHDELSLVGFASHALTRIPPTTDPELIVAGVESLEPQIMRDGTDLSLAVLAGARGLLASEREPRVVVLLTDGAHNGTGVLPLAAARAAAELGVRVHSISILPPEDPTLPPRGPGLVRLAEEMGTVLQEMSGLTGGRYFHATSRAELDSIYAEVARLEAPVEERTEQEEREPLLPWLLWASLLLLGTEGAVRASRLGVLP